MSNGPGPDPLALVQPTPFHAAFGIVPLTTHEGVVVNHIHLRIDSTSGSFVQIMAPENAKRFADQLVQLAEQAQQGNALVKPSSGLVVPNGHAPTS